MQIPPDEPAAHTAEITGTFSEERISSMEITGGAAINPVYDTT